MELIAALVGGIIAGGFSWLATSQLLQAERDLRKVEADAKIKAFLAALYHEIDSVWELYMSGAGKSMEELKEPNKGFMFIVPSMSNYFPIYAGNIANVGLIPDATLRGKITRTYTCAMSLMDGYRLNNKLIELAENAIERDSLLDLTLQSELRKRYVEAAMTRIKKAQMYGPMLKREHDKCKENVIDLLPLLGKYA